MFDTKENDEKLIQGVPYQIGLLTGSFFWMTTLINRY